MAETGESAGRDGGTEVAVQARGLLRAARAGTLATATGGQPFASLVTPACAPDLSILVFLSRLSEHTRHLEAEPRCALMVQGAPTSANPQTAPRVTVIGRAARCDDATLKARWLAVHPYAALYAEFTDFGLFRIVPEGASLIGGFARAYRLGAQALLPDQAAVRAIAAAEAGILSHCNCDHADAMDVLAAGAGHVGTGWRMVGVDCDGCDLALGEVVWRCAWPGTIDDADGVRAALISLVRAARQ